RIRRQTTLLLPKKGKHPWVSHCTHAPIAPFKGFAPRRKEKGSMIPTARQLLLEVYPRSGKKTATRDLLEEKFFCSLRLSNGVYKRTWAGRFHDVDQTLIAEFQRLGVAPKTFLDVAVSSGASPIRWLESLQEAGLRPSIA